MSRKNLQSREKHKFLGSVFVLIGSYLLLILCAFLMIIINDPKGWTAYFEHDYSRFISMCVCALLLFGVTYYYCFYFEDGEFLASAKNLFMVFVILIFCIVLCYLAGRFLNIYARPVALCAFLCLFLFNRRQATMLNFIFSLLMFVIDVYTNNFQVAGATSEVYFSLILGIVCGTFAVFAAAHVKTRGGLMLTGIFLALSTVVIVLLLELPTEKKVEGLTYYFATAGCGIAGSVLSAVLSLSLLPLFEVAFNRLTVFRLRELTAVNAPLLVRLRTEAPGTFNHSLIVAQLSETCSIAIGENAELARAAAYYHDVGKLKQPECFTENQTDYNMHDELTPELSADIIRSHARDGYELLNAAHLPAEIADVALQHHGTLPIKYFYDKANRLSGGDANIRDYSYLGPTPRTKIAAIVMIADASEAASRAIKDRSPDKVEQVVRSIIEERMDLDQFAECNITMRELTIIKQTLVAALSGVHHHRVKYPAIRFNRARQAVKEDYRGKDDE